MNKTNNGANILRMSFEDLTENEQDEMARCLARYEETKLAGNELAFDAADDALQAFIRDILKKYSNLESVEE